MCVCVYVTKPLRSLAHGTYIYWLLLEIGREWFCSMACSELMNKMTDYDSHAAYIKVLVSNFDIVVHRILRLMVDWDKYLTTTQNKTKLHISKQGFRGLVDMAARDAIREGDGDALDAEWRCCMVEYHSLRHIKYFRCGHQLLAGEYSDRLVKTNFFTAHLGTYISVTFLYPLIL